MQDIPQLEGQDVQLLWRQATQIRLLTMFRHASQAASQRRKWFPDMWHHRNNGADEEEDVDHDEDAEDDEDDEDDLDGVGAEDQPPTEPQAEPTPLAEGRPATTSPPESDDWFAAQFRLQREGTVRTRICDRY